MRKTKGEIDVEIAALEAALPRVRRLSSFGDDNRGAVSAAIQVLTESLNENQIYARWPSDNQSDTYLRDNALDARNWSEGHSDESPSSGWKGLLR